MIEHPCPPFTLVRYAPIGAASKEGVAAERIGSGLADCFSGSLQGSSNALQANAVSTSLLPTCGPRGFKSILTWAGEERRRVLFEGWQEGRDVRRPASDRSASSLDSGEVIRAVVQRKVNSRRPASCVRRCRR